MTDQPQPFAGAGKPGFSRALAAVLIVLAGLMAYANTFSAPFVFDDKVNVLDNPSIRSLTPVSAALSAPPGKGTAGRPILNLSYAVNYAVSGLSPWSYHVVDLAIHLLAGLLLFGIVRLTLETPRLAGRYGGRAPFLAFSAALLWTVHPLATEAVTYVTQRAESGMGLFFLASLYAAIRGFGKRPVNIWHAAAAASLALGAGFKEVIAAAPLVILAWDAVFNERPPLKALRRSWFLYAGLFLGLMFLAALVAGGGTAGADPIDRSVSRLAYLVTEGGVILHYLRESLVPVGLAFDAQDWDTSLTAGKFLAAGLTGALVILTAWGLFRRRPEAFLGAWFFLILAPTSSFMPLKCPAYDHRMYLPLAAAVTAVVLFADRLLSGRFARGGAKAAPAAVLLVAAALLIGLTLARNHEYRSDIAIWTDTLQKRPKNARAELNLAQALENAGDPAKALVHYARGLAMTPDPREAARAHFNMANILSAQGRSQDAENHYRAAIEILPAFPEALTNLAVLFSNSGRYDEAEHLYDRALFYNPSLAAARFNYAGLLARRGQWAAAAGHYEGVLALLPDYAPARANLAVCREKMR